MGKITDEGIGFVKDLMRSKPDIDVKLPSVSELESKLAEIYYQPKEKPATSGPTPKGVSDIATGCLPCAVSHFSTSSGILKEALRFKNEGITSNEILDRIAIALEEQNSLEREDLTPEKIQGLPEWEKTIANEALSQSRRLRHRLENVQSLEDLEQVAADARSYYVKLNRQWYKGRFGKLGSQKAEIIAEKTSGS